MVVSYLEKIREQYQEKRIDANSRLMAVQNEYKENTEFIKLLEVNNDPTFESFTPRQVNGFHKAKIGELEDRQKQLTNIMSDIRGEISSIDSEIYELNSVIKVAKEKLGSEEFQDEARVKLALLETQENERQRIARELHDSTVQNLTSLVHKTEICSKIMDVDPIRCKLELSSMNKILRDVIDDTRNMIYDLRPMSFDDIGFDVTVERFLDKIKLISGTNISFNIDGNTYPIKSVIGITLLRVIQEACNNAIKHSDASNIQVTLIYHPSLFTVEIKDNGKGFFVDSNHNVSREDNSGFGLSMMRERIFLLSGELIIESEPGKGCCIKAQIPVEEEER
mgnify:CR=1 FL=1